MVRSIESVSTDVVYPPAGNCDDNRHVRHSSAACTRSIAGTPHPKVTHYYPKLFRWAKSLITRNLGVPQGLKSIGRKLCRSSPSGSPGACISRHRGRCRPRVTHDFLEITPIAPRVVAPPSNNRRPSYGASEQAGDFRTVGSRISGSLYYTFVASVSNGRPTSMDAKNRLAVARKVAQVATF